MSKWHSLPPEKSVEIGTSTEPPRKLTDSDPLMQQPKAIDGSAQARWGKIPELTVQGEKSLAPRVQPVTLSRSEPTPLPPTEQSAPAAESRGQPHDIFKTMTRSALGRSVPEDARKEFAERVCSSVSLLPPTSTFHFGSGSSCPVPPPAPVADDRPGFAPPHVRSRSSTVLPHTAVLAPMPGILEPTTLYLAECRNKAPRVPEDGARVFTMLQQKIKGGFDATDPAYSRFPCRYMHAANTVEGKHIISSYSDPCSMHGTKLSKPMSVQWTKVRRPSFFTLGNGIILPGGTLYRRIDGHLGTAVQVIGTVVAGIISHDPKARGLYESERDSFGFSLDIPIAKGYQWVQLSTTQEVSETRQAIVNVRPSTPRKPFVLHEYSEGTKIGIHMELGKGATLDSEMIIHGPFTYRGIKFGSVTFMHADGIMATIHNPAYGPSSAALQDSEDSKTAPTEALASQPPAPIYVEICIDRMLSPEGFLPGLVRQDQKMQPTPPDVVRAASDMVMAVSTSPSAAPVHRQSNMPPGDCHGIPSTVLPKDSRRFLQVPKVLAHPDTLTVERIREVADERRCGYCAMTKPRSELHLCGRCMCVRYCDEACQTAHWESDHAMWCMAAARNPADLNRGIVESDATFRFGPVAIPRMSVTPSEPRSDEVGVKASKQDWFTFSAAKTDVSRQAKNAVNNIPKKSTEQSPAVKEGSLVPTVAALPPTAMSSPAAATNPPTPSTDETRKPDGTPAPVDPKAALAQNRPVAARLKLKLEKRAAAQAAARKETKSSTSADCKQVRDEKAADASLCFPSEISNERFFQPVDNATTLPTPIIVQKTTYKKIPRSKVKPGKRPARLS
ncbi:hypothetical protein HKX48_004213 [Thoreauomyces humboldtii]|nr:hypothetical protein HKX48_004213 [Thoreauomyces humboldtii]